MSKFTEMLDDVFTKLQNEGWTEHQWEAFNILMKKYGINTSLESAVDAGDVLFTCRLFDLHCDLSKKDACVAMIEAIMVREQLYKEDCEIREDVWRNLLRKLIQEQVTLPKFTEDMLKCYFDPLSEITIKSKSE